MEQGVQWWHHRQPQPRAQPSRVRRYWDRAATGLICPGRRHPTALNVEATEFDSSPVDDGAAAQHNNAADNDSTVEFNDGAHHHIGAMGFHHTAHDNVGPVGFHHSADHNLGAMGFHHSADDLWAMERNADADNLRSVGLDHPTGREHFLPADHYPRPERADHSAAAPAVHSAARRLFPRHGADRRSRRPHGWLLRAWTWGTAATATERVWLEQRPGARPPTTTLGGTSAVERMEWGTAPGRLEPPLGGSSA